MREPAAGTASRRTLLRGMAAGLTAASLPCWTRFAYAAAGVTVTDMADGLYLMSGAGGNMLALATDDGLALVDSGSADFSDSVVATVGELSSGHGVTALFNTHWHPDQVGANAALGAAGATIFAHEKTRQRLTTGYYLPAEDRYEPALPQAGLPTETFYTEGGTRIGGQAVEYGYLIEAHTDGDIYVAFPDRNVIAVGDVVAPERDPELDWYGGGWLGGRLDSLATLLERSDADTRFVPSHGPVVGRAEVEAEQAMLTVFFDRFVERIRLGESARDMLKAGILDGLGREFAEPYRFLDDNYNGFWAHHNALMHDIV
jgi:cyclase